MSASSLSSRSGIGRVAPFCMSIPLFDVSHLPRIRFSLSWRSSYLTGVLENDFFRVTGLLTG